MAREGCAHVNGPGLKVVGSATWYGGGSCGICGHSPCGRKGCDGGCASPLVARRVRWWDPDDGWKSGVLCLGCGNEARERGPKLDDFAVVTAKRYAEKGEHLAEGDVAALTEDARELRIIRRLEREGDVWRVRFTEGAAVRLAPGERLWVCSATSFTPAALDAMDAEFAGDDDGAHTATEAFRG